MLNEDSFHSVCFQDDARLVEYSTVGLFQNWCTVSWCTVSGISDIWIPLSCKISVVVCYLMSIKQVFSVSWRLRSMHCERDQRITIASDMVWRSDVVSCKVRIWKTQCLLGISLDAALRVWPPFFFVARKTAICKCMHVDHVKTWVW